MALLKHRKISLTDYLELSSFDSNTEYTLENSGRIVGRAIGDTIISGGRYIDKTIGTAQREISINNLYKVKGKVLIVLYTDKIAEGGFDTVLGQTVISLEEMNNQEINRSIIISYDMTTHGISGDALFSVNRDSENNFNISYDASSHQNISMKYAVYFI